MRLHVLLSKVDPKAMSVPTKCAYANCTSKQVRLHQPVSKALRDTVHQQVEVHRYRCLRMSAYLPGLSCRREPCSKFRASQRARRYALSVGAQLWSRLVGVG